LSEYIAFPYPAVEQVMLDLMKTITPADILPVTNTSEMSDQLEKLLGQLGKVEHGIANAQSKMQADPFMIDSLSPVVRNLAVQKQEFEASIEEIRHELHSSLPTTDECQKLSQLVQDATGKELDLNRRRFSRSLSLNCAACRCTDTG
jgi:chromosome segregation ATPase